MKKLLALVFAFAVVACGKRGDPRPPVPVIPQATSDLVVTQRATNVVLSWSYPSVTTAGRSLPSLRRIVVYRYDEELPVQQPARDPNAMLPGDADPTIPQPVALFSRVPTIAAAQFAKLATRLDSIESANLPAATTGAKLTFTDAPPLRARDGRPIRITYAVVTEGPNARSELSNLATIIPLDVASAPASLTATARPEGVVLSWQAATTPAMGGDAKPVVAGYNVYRTARGSAPDLFTAPVNPAPITTTTFNDVPPYGEHEYRVSAVASAAQPAIESALSNAATATFKDLVPPPTPQNVTALLETRIVRLIWDPVEAADLAGYQIYRYEERSRTRLKLTTGATPNTHFGDESIELGITYRYEVTSVDKNGNESKPGVSRNIVVPRNP